MEDWEKIAAGVVLVIGAMSKVVFDYRKAKADERHAEERLQVLRDIAMSNRDIRSGQLLQNGKLATIMEVNGARHSDIIRTLNSSCKARPIFPMEEQKDKA